MRVNMVKTFKAWSTVVFYLLVMLCCGQIHAQSTSKRLALVIGNDEYQYVNKLQKAGNDATAMARELSSAGFEVLLHKNLNYRGMVKAVETLTDSITGGDQVVVFFAGHGVQIKTGSYLLPTDIEASSESEVEKTAYALNDLTDKLSDAKASFALVMVDACRDNPIKSKGRSVGNSRGLSPIDPPKGQMVIFSASKGQQALDRLNDNDDNPNGVFTREFIKRMRLTGVRVEDMVRDVQDSVEALARTVSHDQRPAMYSESRGNFYFYAPVASASSTLNTTDATNLDREDGYWAGTKAAGNLEAYQAYSDMYPNGRYVKLAMAAITRLSVDAALKAEREKPVAFVVGGANDIAKPVIILSKKVNVDYLKAPQSRNDLDGRSFIATNTSKDAKWTVQIEVRGNRLYTDAMFEDCNLCGSAYENIRINCPRAVEIKEDLTFEIICSSWGQAKWITGKFPNVSVSGFGSWTRAGEAEMTFLDVRLKEQFELETKNHPKLSTAEFIKAYNTVVGQNR
jgi:hypothetical protein